MLKVEKWGQEGATEYRNSQQKIMNATSLDSVLRFPSRILQTTTDKQDRKIFYFQMKGRKSYQWLTTETDLFSI